MKRFIFSHLVLAIGLLFVNIGSAWAQAYASVLDLPVNKWDFFVRDLSGNQVSTLAPNTSYTLYIRLNPGVTVTDLVAYLVEDGDGWYQNANERPQVFPTGVDAFAGADNKPSVGFSFTTVEAVDFSGAFFKVRASRGGQISTYRTNSSSPKSKLF